MSKQLDILFVNTNSAKEIYQDLSNEHSAIEVPFWSLLLAQSCRSKGFSVGILDTEAERLTDEQSLERIKNANPRLVCFVTYSQNPNGGTSQFGGVVRLGQKLRETYPQFKTCSVGSHTSALPREVLSYDFIDFVCINEGVYALHSLLATDLKTDLHKVKALGYKDSGNPILNDAQNSLVPNDRMDIDLPGYAWDLLPKREKFLDLYRAHNWHVNFNYKDRTPFASIYTSLGCSFRCNFCLINILNRTNTEDRIVSSDSNIMRFWSPEFIANQIGFLVENGVKHIRLLDEMFFLNKKYYEPLLKLIVERGYEINSWAYARINTVKEEYLDLFKRAGINWLALGIEAANQRVRQEITKGFFKDIDIRDVVSKIRTHDINVIGNYIYGFQSEDETNLQETYDLSVELNTEMVNKYTCMALPGSPLYYEAKDKGYELPQKYEDWSFYGYGCTPLPTQHLSPKQVLNFRDKAWYNYMTRPEYLAIIERKFGLVARQNIEEMSKIRLRRKLLGDNL